MENLKFKLTGTAPLLMHNGRMANPFDPFAIAVKEITTKRKKTEEDAIVIYWLEWLGSLYTPKLLSPSEAESAVVTPVIPESNLLSFLNDGARHSKQGQDVWRAASIVSGAAELKGTGWPAKSTLKQIYESGKFNDIRSVVNPSTSGRTMRSRPIFRDWWLEFEVAIDTEILNPKDVLGFVKRAAQYNGLADGKPLFGRCVGEQIE